MENLQGIGRAVSALIIGGNSQASSCPLEGTRRRSSWNPGSRAAGKRASQTSWAFNRATRLTHSTWKGGHRGKSLPDCLSLLHRDLPPEPPIGQSQPGTRTSRILWMAFTLPACGSAEQGEKGWRLSERQMDNIQKIHEMAQISACSLIKLNFQACPSVDP